MAMAACCRKSPEYKTEFVPLGVGRLGIETRFVAWCPPTANPFRTTRAAYIVNTYPEGVLGLHWFAIWTEYNVCEVMDSYGLPLTRYGAPHLLEWLDRWPHLQRSEQTLQALNSAACGHYALSFLKDRARGLSLLEFVQEFSPYDLVANDRTTCASMDHGRSARTRRSLKQCHVPYSFEINIIVKNVRLCVEN